jgi:hypothetical protein
MARNADIPELLERFMEESGESRRWVTVHEIRAYFSLDMSASSAISGFLQRNYSGTYLSFPYRVERIERVSLDVRPHPRTIKKYLIAKRPGTREKKLPRAGPDHATGIHGNIFTDYDAVEHFNRLLGRKRAHANSQE